MKFLPFVFMCKMFVYRENFDFHTNLLIHNVTKVYKYDIILFHMFLIHTESLFYYTRYLIWGVFKSSSEHVYSDREECNYIPSLHHFILDSFFIIPSSFISIQLLLSSVF